MRWRMSSSVSWKHMALKFIELWLLVWWWYYGDPDHQNDETNLNSIVFGECEVLINWDLSIVGRVGLVKKTRKSWGHKYFFKCISNIKEYLTCLLQRLSPARLKTTDIFSVMIHDCVTSHPDGFCCPSAFWQSQKPSWKRTFLQKSFSSSVIQYSIQTKLKWIKLEAILLYHKSFPIVLHNLKLVSAPKEAQLDTAHKIQRNLRNLWEYLVGTTHIPRCPHCEWKSLRRFQYSLSYVTGGMDPILVVARFN